MLKNYTIVTLKSFGDFVIAANAINLISKENGQIKIEFAAARHVFNLASALGIEDHITFIDCNKNSDIPSIYNLKKCGFLSGAKSLIELRQNIANIPSSPSSALVFDRLGWRERLIGLGHNLLELSHKANNIYYAYDLFFKELGCTIRSDISVSKFFFTRVIIIPGARVKERVIPKSVIQKIAKKLSNYGLDVKVVLLDGEFIEMPIGVCVEVIPRQFTSLIATIKSSDLVISADSLPAHLSEFLNIPIFVFTPIPNWTNYWLPRSAFKSKGMTSFEDIEHLYEWLCLR